MPRPLPPTVRRAFARRLFTLATLGTGSIAAGCGPDTATAPSRAARAAHAPGPRFDYASLRSNGALYDQHSTSLGFIGQGGGTADTYFADDFVVPPGGSWSVGAVAMSGYLDGGSSTVTFEIRADNAGKPGAVVAGSSVTLAPSATTSNACCGADGVMRDYLFTLATPITLAPGTYWLAVRSGTTSEATFDWQYGAAATGAAALMSTDGGTTWWPDVLGANGVRDFAFALYAPASKQTITFPAITPNPALVGGTAALGASATSGLAVAYGTQTPAVCTVSGSTLTFVGAGTCTVTADQAGSADYLAAPQQTQSVTVQSAAQAITFTSTPPSAARVGGSYAVSATGGASGTAVTFTSLTPGTCTVSGSTVSLVAAGTCTVAADQAGGAGYAAAPQQTQSFTVSRVAQTAKFTSAPPSPAYVGTTYAASASATSGLAVTLTSLTPATCTVAGGTVSFVAAGACTLAADQAGTAAYAAAAQVTQTITIVQHPQAITFSPAPPASAVLGSSLTLTATGGTSGSPVVLRSLTGTCTLTGTTVTFTAVGACTITADQAGATSYDPAPRVTRTIAVVYAFTGFFAPVNALPTVNTASAGQAIPLTFALGGNQGLGVLAAGAPTAQAVACQSGASTGTVTQAATAGASGLQYNAASGQYTYVWMTNKAWAGTCRLLTLTLADGTQHTASFQFTK